MSNFKKYNTKEFEEYIKNIAPLRKINKIQLHHTYSPSYKQFTGDNHISLQNGMRNYHINTNGWSDIAQHFTIFPDGAIVAGRSLEIVPAGIKGANTGAIAIECLGNFDRGGDKMTDAQKNAIVSVVKRLTKKFSLAPETSVIYHAWWTSSGKNLGDYDRAKSSKTCPGTNFFGGNTRRAFEEHLMPLLTGDMSITDAPADYINVPVHAVEPLKPVETVNDIIWELANAGIVTDAKLWMTKSQEDVNVYHLCRKMANYLRGTL